MKINLNWKSGIVLTTLHLYSMNEIQDAMKFCINHNRKFIVYSSETGWDIAIQVSPIDDIEKIREEIHAEK